MPHRDEFHYPDRRSQSLIGQVSLWYHKWQPMLALIALFAIGTGWQVVKPIERIERIEAQVQELQTARELAETQATLTCLTSPDVRALALSRMPCARLLRDIETPEAEVRRRELYREAARP